MSRLWSKKCVRLTIAPSSVALRDVDGKTYLVANNLALDFTQDMDALKRLLEKYQTSLTGKSVEVVLAHHFVRFLVLPWQQVFRKQDWQAIASHAFRKTFGSVATDWQIDVNLSRYKKPAVAAAIDRTILAGLKNLKEEFNFELKSIAPLVNFCTLQSKWGMIVEPERLLLIQGDALAWQQIWVDAPPVGEEQKHADQLVQRTLLQLPKQQLPKRIPVFISAELQPSWQKNTHGVLQQMNTNIEKVPHAVWMSQLSMQSKMFKFSSENSWFASWRDLALCGLMVGLAVVLCLAYQTQLTELTQLQGQQAQLQPKKNPLQQDAQLVSQLENARQAQQILNRPWLETLAQLEEVKRHQAAVKLMSVEPNTSRAQVYLKVKSKDFAYIMQFLEALKMQPLFANAELINQYAEDESFSVYEIKVDWKI